jgi:hypothetical protein
MKVLNEVGREMSVSQSDYDRLTAMGLKLRRLETEKKTYDTEIYTAICGEYPLKRKELICFGENGVFKKPVMEAKIYKVLPHLYFDKDITVWIDGNIYNKIDKNYLVDRFLGNSDIGIFKHPFRETVWQEFQVLKEDKRFADKWLQKRLKEQKEYYIKEGLPKNTPLFECNFIIRRNNEKVNRLMEAWWAEICRWQWRDQVSFPYVLWKYGKEIDIKIEKGNIRKNKFFKHIETR